MLSTEYLFRQKFTHTWRKFSRREQGSYHRSYWIWNILRRVSESLNTFEIRLYPFHESNKCDKFVRKACTNNNKFNFFTNVWNLSTRRRFSYVFFFLLFFQSNESIQFPNKNYIPSDIHDETLRCEFTLRKYTSLANCIIVIESY